MINIVQKSFKQGLWVALLYLLLLIVNDLLHITNIKVSNTDFYLDTIKSTLKFDKNKFVITPVYVIEITDSDIKKYNLNGYALPKEIIEKILKRYSASEAKVIFLDLDIGRYSCIDSNKPTVADENLVKNINHLSKKIILPFFVNHPPLYNQFNNPLISILSVEYLVSSDKNIKYFNTSIEQKESVSYVLYKEMAGGDVWALQEENRWIDKTFSNIIIYKDFDGNHSYYSGLSKLSLDEFLNSKDDFIDALLLIGRVDKGSYDFFNTPIGVLPGIYVHANSIMSMFYYGVIKSYYILNFFIAFFLGMGFNVAFEYLKLTTELDESQEELLAALGIIIFSSFCVVVSYFLLETYSIWLDYQKVVFIFSIYEVIKLISQFIRKNR